MSEQRSILQIALDVKMTKDGSYGGRRDEQQQEDIKILKDKLNRWRIDSKTTDFDYAVKHVIKEALEYEFKG